MNRNKQAVRNAERLAALIKYLLEDRTYTRHELNARFPKDTLSVALCMLQCKDQIELVKFSEDHHDYMIRKKRHD